MMLCVDECWDVWLDVRLNSVCEMCEWRVMEGRDVMCCVYAGATSARGDEFVEDGDEFIVCVCEWFGIEL